MTNSAKLASLSVVCAAAVVFAVFSQQVWDMRPCPWCIIQRMLFILASIIAAIGAVLARTSRPTQTFRKQRIAYWPWITIGFIAAIGTGSAIYQHLIASNQSSCSISHAQSFVMATGLDEWLPSLFLITGSCADAATAKLLGVPYELASALLFGIIVGWCILSIRRGYKQ